jgi:Leucine-rich repeat (LRR) protein
MRAMWLVLAGCAHHAIAPPVIARKAPVPAPPAPPTWPVPVHVMTWTADGIVDLGAWPVPAPTTPWFVEPQAKLDHDTFEKLIAAVRREHVPGLSLRGQRLWLDEIEDLPELHALVLSDTDAVDPSITHVSLTRLYLARTAVDDAAIERVVAAQPDLEVLDLEDCEIGDASAREVAKLASLHALNLSGTQITDGGGAALGVLAHLEILDLGHTAVGAKTVAAIRPLALRQLFLDQTRVGKEIASLSGYAPGIVRFDVSSLAAYAPTDADLAWLAHAPNLVEAGLSGARVHDDLVKQIAALPELRVLRLARTPITIASIAAIAKLAGLEEIDLAETPVDNASAQAMIALPKLRVLRLDHTPITDAALHAVPGPMLAELYLSKTSIGDTELLDKTPNLVALGLGETQVGDATLARVAKLVKLRTLVLSAMRPKTASFAQLGALHDLERLYLDQTPVDDTAIAAFAELHQLRVLHLAGTEISDLALQTLSALPLEELTIGDTRVSPAVAEIDAWPHLRTLSLLGLALHDPQLPALAKRWALQTLDVSSTDVTDPAALSALPHLHTLGLAQVKLSRDGKASAAKLVAHGVDVVR